MSRKCPKTETQYILNAFNSIRRHFVRHSDSKTMRYSLPYQKYILVFSFCLPGSLSNGS